MPVLSGGEFDCNRVGYPMSLWQSKACAHRTSFSIVTLRPSTGAVSVVPSAAASLHRRRRVRLMAKW
jgi:hypothetical protein